MNTKNIALLSTGLVVGGFALHSAIQYHELMNYDYTIGNVLVKHIDRNTISVEVHINLDNKSMIDAHIFSYDIDVYLNDKYVGKLVSDKKQYIKANGISDLVLFVDVPLKQHFNIGEILKMLDWYFTDPSKINFRLFGKIKAKHWIIPLNIPVDIKYNLSEILDENNDANKNNE